MVGVLVKKYISILFAFLFVFVLSSCTNRTKEFTFNKDSYTLYVSDSVDIVYTLIPTEINANKIIWESSNNDIATIDNGRITAISSGICEITARIDNFRCKCSVSVIEETVFEELLPEDMLKLTFYNLLDGGNCLKVDTNPFNTGSLMGNVGERDLSVIKTLNEKLKLPKSLTEKMAQTRAIDGRLTEQIGDLEISWTYSPESGLEAIYEKIKI